MWTEVLETLDWPERPELYVSQTPVAKEVAVGFDKPFVVIHSGLLEILEEDELRSILGHELGHIMSGHPTYTTIAIILMYFGVSNLPFLAAAALLPFQLALLEWSRKSEFSSDRAGLLAVQDLNTVMGAEMKLSPAASRTATNCASRSSSARRNSTRRAATRDTVLKILNTVMRTHPMHTVRAAELLRWQRGGFDKIMAGDYVRRGGGDKDQPLGEDYADAAGYYGRRPARRSISSRMGSARARCGERGVAEPLTILLVGGGGRDTRSPGACAKKIGRLAFSPRPAIRASARFATW
jgi:hypothetical protein